MSLYRLKGSYIDTYENKWVMANTITCIGPYRNTSLFIPVCNYGYYKGVVKPKHVQLKGFLYEFI